MKKSIAHEQHEHHHAGHSHSHAPVITSVNRAFVTGIVLNLAYVMIQVVMGLRINSLSLLSDAGHNFLDVAGLALAIAIHAWNKLLCDDRF